MSYRAWRYHSEHEPKVFEADQLEAAEADGWKDSPAKCEGFLNKVGVDPSNSLQVQFVGEVTEQAAEVMNLMENLDTLDKTGLIRLAELHLSEDWSKKRGLEKMRASMKTRLDADNVIEAE